MSYQRYVDEQDSPQNIICVRLNKFRHGLRCPHTHYLIIIDRYIAISGVASYGLWPCVLDD